MIVLPLTKMFLLILPMSCVQIISRKHLYPLNGQITILAFLIQDLGMLSVITPCGKKFKRLEKIPDIYSTFSKSSNFGFAPCSDFARERVLAVE